MATKRKIAEQVQDSTTTDAETTTLAGQAPVANSAADAATPTDGQQQTLREPGDDTAADRSAGQKKSRWAPRTTIAIPLTEEAKRDHTKGEVARYIDGYNDGVGVRIDSPDKSFRPSEDVKAPLKEDHPHRDSMRWNKKDFHKKVAGTRPDGRERNPVAERLDGESRFEEMVQRRREEIEKADGGKTPL